MGYLNYKLLTITHTLLRLHQNPIEIKQKNTKLKKKHIAFFKSTLGRGSSLQFSLPQASFSEIFWHKISLACEAFFIFRKIKSL